MNVHEQRFIKLLGERSYFAVGAIATLFAVAGPAFNIWVGQGDMWPLWIPFCYMVLPAIHHLAKQSLSLDERLARLEQGEENRKD